jgi:hypothetical protein
LEAFEQMRLEDGIRLHESVKVELEIAVARWLRLVVSIMTA